MAINFSKLPTENPYSLPPVGIYKATITKAEVKNGPKGPYLELGYALSNGKGQRFGIMYDKMSEGSQHQIVLFKLGRFVSALKLNLTGEVPFKDLAKVVVNKSLCVDVEHRPDNRFKDDPTKIKAEVRVFGTDIFWPIEEYDRLAAISGDTADGTGTEGEAAPPNDDDAPFLFDAEDGEIPPTVNEQPQVDDDL